MKVAFKSVTEGKLQQALEQFRNVLKVLPFVTADRSAQEDDAKELVSLIDSSMQTPSLTASGAVDADQGVP